jgi:hypothetical protein
LGHFDSGFDNNDDGCSDHNDHGRFDNNDKYDNGRTVNVDHNNRSTCR